MSRFEKLPLYMAWAGLLVTEAAVASYCWRFSHSSFVASSLRRGLPVSKRILRRNPYAQELSRHGNPRTNINPGGHRFASVLSRFRCADKRGCDPRLPFATGGATFRCPDDRRCEADLDAAEENGFRFAAQTCEQQAVFCNYTGDSVEDFVGL